MLHQVKRKFKAEGKNLTVGEIIETSHWKNERLLLEHRFIGKPSVPQEKKAEVKAGARFVKPPGVASKNVLKKKAEPPEPAKAAAVRPSVLSRPKQGMPVVGRVPAAKD